MGLVQDCFEMAGLSQAFSVVSDDEFFQAVDEAGLYDSLANGSFSLFLKSLLCPGLIPATYNKLAFFGWADDDIGLLFEGGVLKESQTTLVNAINSGAFSVKEFDEYALMPNQEIMIIYYTDKVDKFLGWLQSHLTVPAISSKAFY